MDTKSFVYIDGNVKVEFEVLTMRACTGIPETHCRKITKMCMGEDGKSELIETEYDELEAIVQNLPLGDLRMAHELCERFGVYGNERHEYVQGQDLALVQEVGLAPTPLVDIEIDIPLLTRGRFKDPVVSFHVIDTQIEYIGSSTTSEWEDLTIWFEEKHEEIEEWYECHDLPRERQTKPKKPNLPEYKCLEAVSLPELTRLLIENSKDYEICGGPTTIQTNTDHSVVSYRNKYTHCCKHGAIMRLKQ